MKIPLSSAIIILIKFVQAKMLQPIDYEINFDAVARKRTADRPTDYAPRFIGQAIQE